MPDLQERATPEVTPVVTRVAARPVGLLGGAVVLWLAVALASGLRYRVPVGGLAVLMLLLGVVLMGVAAGLTSGTRATVAGWSSDDGDAGLRRGLVWGVAMSFASLAIRLALGQAWLPDFSAETIAQSRVNLGDGSISLSQIGTPMATFGVPVAIILILTWGRLSRGWQVLGLLAVLQYLMFGLAQGSRTHIAFLVVSCLIVYRIRSKRIDWRLVGAALLAGVVVMGLSSWLLAGRLQAQGYNSRNALSYLSREHGVAVPSALSSFAWNHASLAPDVYTLVSLEHYFEHGVFEYFRLADWQQQMNSPLSLGGATMGSIYNGLLKVCGVAPPVDRDVYPTLGVYRTLWGAFLADGGFAGVLLGSVGVGLVAGRLYRRVVRSGTAPQSLIAYAPVAAIVVMAPFFNAIAGAYGLYTCIACWSIATVVSRGRREP